MLPNTPVSLFLFFLGVSTLSLLLPFSFSFSLDLLFLSLILSLSLFFPFSFSLVLRGDSTIFSICFLGDSTCILGDSSVNFGKSVNCFLGDSSTFLGDSVFLGVSTIAIPDGPIVNFGNSVALGDSFNFLGDSVVFLGDSIGFLGDSLLSLDFLGVSPPILRVLSLDFLGESVSLLLLLLLLIVVLLLLLLLSLTLSKDIEICIGAPNLVNVLNHASDSVVVSNFKSSCCPLKYNESVLPLLSSSGKSVLILQDLISIPFFLSKGN